MPVALDMLDGGEMATAVRRAMAQEPRIVVAGGDGTVSCAAGVLAGSAVELAVLPLGTLNHLARDSGIPFDLTAAAKLAAHGRAVGVDTVRVADHVFVNNASIGLYPQLVREREFAQERHGLSKWTAALLAVLQTFRRVPKVRLSIDLGHGPKPVETPLLFVGNNRYSLAHGSVGRRETLQDGRMCVFVVRPRSRFRLALAGLRIVLGLAQPRSDFTAIGSCERLAVSDFLPATRIALDGEVTTITGPLEFTMQPGSLRLVSDGAGRAASQDRQPVRPRNAVSEN